MDFFGSCAGLHRSLDRRDVFFGRSLDPGAVHGEHDLYAVTVLTGTPQEVLADHQMPADARVASRIGFPVADLQALDDVAPTHVNILEIADRLAVVAEEHVVVLDFSSARVLLAQGELALQHGEGPRAELHRSILVGFGAVLVVTQDDGLADLDCALCEIAVDGTKADLFGLPQAGKEPELIEVAYGLAPFGVNTPDQGFRFVNAEWIDLRTILLGKPKALQACRRVRLAQ